MDLLKLHFHYQNRSIELRNRYGIIRAKSWMCRAANLLAFFTMKQTVNTQTSGVLDKGSRGMD